MKNPFRSALMLAVAATAVILCGSIAHAGVNSDTIGIKFGVEYPPKAFSIMNAGDIAGVSGFQTGNWNNGFRDSRTLFLATHDFENSQSNLGLINGLVRDTNGAATTTNAVAEWSAEGTWASSGMDHGDLEENNNFAGTNAFPSPDRKLMLGYLDHNSGGLAFHTNWINITGLDPAFAASYSVIVYELPSVSGRGGTYTVNGKSQTGTGGDPGSGTNGPAYVQDPGDGTGPGNYLLFKGVSGTTCKIRARNDNLVNPTGTRAVINAVELVSTPGGDGARANPPARPLQDGPGRFPLELGGLGTLAVVLGCGWLLKRRFS
jgi:hypothetical protein